MMLRRAFLLIVLGVLGGWTDRALAASGTEGASFLDIPVGAGPAALGGAYTALATDLYAPVWNPAGLGFLESTQVGGQHLAYLESIHYEHLGFVIPLTRPAAAVSQGEKAGAQGGLGVSAQYLGSGDIAGSNLDGTDSFNYSSHYGAYSLAYGRPVTENLALGLTGKFIEAKISDVSAHAYAADLGALYKVGSHAALAATLTNLGSKLKFLNDDSSLPVAGHLAAAYSPNPHWLGSLEGVFPKTGVIGAHLGLQWQPLEMIAIRTGYKTETSKELGAIAGLTVGAGINVWGQELAYAWVPYGDLGDTQYFSLVLRFGEVEKTKQNLIRGEEIKSHRSVGTGKEDPEGQQLMQMLKDEADRNALAPAVGVKAPEEPAR